MTSYIYKELGAIAIENLCRRNSLNDEEVTGAVKDIIHTVKTEGDIALYSYSKTFDGVQLSQLFAGKVALQAQAALVTDKQQAAIDTAYRNIYVFHAAQQKQEAKIETVPGVTCWREARAIDSVGLYVPGGTAVLPSTLMMLGIPAVIACCKEIVVCSPPQKDGKVNPYIAYVALKLGLEGIYTIGGAQAIAALAFGTATVPKVFKVFGPGNRYVTAAKTLLQAEGVIAIDMPAGPSEVLVIADEAANPAFVAADLLSQAEHGADSQAILVTTSIALITSVQEELTPQLQVLPRAAVAQQALANSYCVLVDDLAQAVEFSNRYAPEHLIINTREYNSLLNSITNAGSVFLGAYTPESAGDYASGTNHTLPTSGCARAYSGVSLDSFVKNITFQTITPQGIQNLGPAIATLASMEGLDAHKNAVLTRLTAPIPQSLNLGTNTLVRPNIQALKPYSSARSLYTSGILMDANENPLNIFGDELGIALNRYPDGSNQALREKLAALNGVTAAQCAVGNGSDELIDLLIRIFCEPGLDKVLITSPTYGMYAVSAHINNVAITDIPLVGNHLNINDIQHAVSPNTKITFFCSPNNPTGDVLRTADILAIAKYNHCIVVVDEAYADFMLTEPLLPYLNQYPNLVILRTLSKAYGMAGARLGYLFAHKTIVDLVQKVKPPYNINQLTTQTVLNALAKADTVKQTVAVLNEERERLAIVLQSIPGVSKVYGSQSNFLLFKIAHADAVFKKLVEKGIIIRSRTNMHGLEDCLRVSIGTKAQNDLFLQALKEITKE